MARSPFLLIRYKFLQGFIKVLYHIIVLSHWGLYFAEARAIAFKEFIDAFGLLAVFGGIENLGREDLFWCLVFDFEVGCAFRLDAVIEVSDLFDSGLELLGRMGFYFSSDLEKERIEFGVLLESELEDVGNVVDGL